MSELQAKRKLKDCENFTSVDCMLDFTYQNTAEYSIGQIYCSGKDKRQYPQYGTQYICTYNMVYSMTYSKIY